MSEWHHFHHPCEQDVHRVSFSVPSVMIITVRRAKGKRAAPHYCPSITNETLPQSAFCDMGKKSWKSEDSPIISDRITAGIDWMGSLPLEQE